MKKTLIAPAVGFAAAALLLVGCSTTSGTDEPAASTHPSAAPSDQPNVQGGDRQGFGGVSGEIVLASDSLVQVQDSESQTAVRYTADTTVSQQVTISLSDVTVGSCVVAMVGEDGTATSVTVTQPVDGECSAGFGGGMGGPGGGQGGGEAPSNGEMPSDAPTAMPDGGDRPTDMPSFDPGDGQMPGGGEGFGGTFVTGSVSAVSATGFTLTSDDAKSASTTTEVAVGTTTSLTGTEDADASAIAVGMCLTAQGQADDAGGFDATSITLSAKGDDGCSTRGFGGMGGMRDGNNG